MDAAIAFSQLATKLEYEDLPQAAVDTAKKDILDTLGTILAGSTAEGAEEMAGLAEEMGGKPESSILAYGFKVPSPEAALVNGFMAHSADYDDTYDVAVIHCGAPVIPAAFAAAERRGRVSGQKFIVAVTLGIELMCRIGLSKKAGRWGGGWSGTRVYGYFGAAMASAHILGLTSEQTSSALGLAYSQASGNLQAVREGVLARNFDVGCASRGGVLACLAAQRGVTGARNSLEGDFGLFNVYHQGKYDPEALTVELGKRFEAANLSFKPYPCARPIHPFVDLALALRREHEIRPEDVQEVIGCVDEEPYLQFHPVKDKQNPKTITDAKLSIPYCVAVALVKGDVVIDDFSQSAIADQQVISMAQKVVPRLDASLARPKEVPPAILEIRTKSATYSKRAEYPRGHPQNPMTMESLLLKFCDCAARASKQVPEANLSEVIDMVSQLEEVKDVGRIVQLLI